MVKKCYIYLENNHIILFPIVTGKNLIEQSKQHQVEDLVPQQTPNRPRDGADPPDTIVP